MKSLTSDLRTSRKVASAVRQGGREEWFDVERRQKGRKIRNDDDENEEEDGKGKVQEFSGILRKASLAFPTRKYVERGRAHTPARESSQSLNRVSHPDLIFQSRDS